MKRAWIGVGLLVGFFVLAMFLMADAAVAQTPPTAPHAGAFDKLSPGNQKIAQALFEAQQTSTGPGAPTQLSRDEIAAMKQSGKGWGVVFKDMKQQGLVTEKNLGQVISGANHATSSSRGTVITSASGRTWVVDSPGGRGYPAASGGKIKSDEGERGGASASAGGQVSASGRGGDGGASAGRSGGHGNGRGR